MYLFSPNRGDQIATSAYGLLAMTYNVLVMYNASPTYNVIVRKPAGTMICW